MQAGAGEGPGTSPGNAGGKRVYVQVASATYVDTGGAAAAVALCQASFRPTTGMTVHVTMAAEGPLSGGWH